MFFRLDEQRSEINSHDVSTRYLALCLQLPEKPLVALLGNVADNEQQVGGVSECEQRVCTLYDITKGSRLEMFVVKSHFLNRQNK